MKSNFSSLPKRLGQSLIRQWMVVSRSPTPFLCVCVGGGGGGGV